MHILKEISPKKFVLLASDKEACTCPFRDSMPQQVPPKAEGGMPQIGFTGQNCGTICPLFQVIRKGQNAKDKDNPHATYAEDAVVLNCAKVPFRIPVEVQNISHIAKPI